MADVGALGSFGDFCGGVLTALFSFLSCILLYKTLNAQREDSNQNFLLIELQRFDKIFFELLHLYQNELSELVSTKVSKMNDGVKEITKGTNKDFFYVEKIKLQDKFSNKSSVFQDIDEIRLLYAKFYTENSSIAHCYRSLYRIYDLIDNSRICDDDKKEYLKILRAQLTESELFFLRYNANSAYGQDFIKYLNKYNVLKHLPILDLLEFKKYWNLLPTAERESLNIVLDVMTRSIKRLLKPRQTQDAILFLDSKKYSISINISRPHMDKLSIHLGVETGVEKCDYELHALDYMDNQIIVSFIKDYLRELFIFSSFQRVNSYHELRLQYQIEQEGDKSSITVAIYNTQGKALKLNKNV